MLRFFSLCALSGSHIFSFSVNNLRDAPHSTPFQPKTYNHNTHTHALILFRPAACPVQQPLTIDILPGLADTHSPNSTILPFLLLTNSVSVNQTLRRGKQMNATSNRVFSYLSLISFLTLVINSNIHEFPAKHLPTTFHSLTMNFDFYCIIARCCNLYFQL